MRKHINSTDKFIDVNTGTLVLDTTPTEGSFNAVTSDGVAKAIAQGGGSKVVKVNSLPATTDPDTLYCIPE